jgi:hypothetical protein
VLEQVRPRVGVAEVVAVGVAEVVAEGSRLRMRLAIMARIRVRIWGKGPGMVRERKNRLFRTLLLGTSLRLSRLQTF